MREKMKMEEKAIYWLEKTLEEMNSAHKWLISLGEGLMHLFHIHLFAFLLLLLILSLDPQSIILTAAHQYPRASN